MTKEDVIKIIEIEKLDFHSIFTSKTTIPNNVVIQKRDNDWIVFSNDERGNVYGRIRFFSNEEEAFDNFLKRLRATNFSIADLKSRVSKI